MSKPEKVSGHFFRVFLNPPPPLSLVLAWICGSFGRDICTEVEIAPPFLREVSPRLLLDLGFDLYLVEIVQVVEISGPKDRRTSKLVKAGPFVDSYC